MPFTPFQAPCIYSFHSIDSAERLERGFYYSNPNRRCFRPFSQLHNHNCKFQHVPRFCVTFCCPWIGQICRHVYSIRKITTCNEIYTNVKVFLRANIIFMNVCGVSCVWWITIISSIWCVLDFLLNYTNEHKFFIYITKLHCGCLRAACENCSSSLLFIIAHISCTSEKSISLRRDKIGVHHNMRYEFSFWVCFSLNCVRGALFSFYIEQMKVKKVNLPSQFCS
jgi:hypothetical protein